MNDTNAEAILFAIPDVGHVAVSDTVANVLFYASQINSSQYIDSVTVADNANNIAGNFDTLNSLVKLTAITLTDSGTPTLSVTEGQLGDTTAFGDITNSAYNLVVTGVLAADAAGIATTVAALGGHPTLTGIYVSDTAGHVSADLDTLASNTYLKGVTLTDSGTVTATQNQVIFESADQAVLREINGGTYNLAVTGVSAEYGAGITGYVDAIISSHITVTSVAVSDNGSAVAQYLNTLNGVSNLTSINLTNGYIAISESQLQNDTTAFGLINNASFNVAVTNVLAADATSIAGEVTAANSHGTVTSIFVTDTAASIAAYFDTLNGLGGTLGGISVQDSNEVTLSAYSAATDTTAESVLSGGSDSGHVAVSDNVANVLNYASQFSSAVDSVSVVDLAANVGGNIDALNSVSSLQHVHLTDSGTPTLTISETQLTGDTVALGAINNSSFNIAVTGVAVADVNSIAGDVTTANANATLSSISIYDTASAIAGGLDALNGDSIVKAITISDGSDPVVVTESQFVNGLTALGEITNNGWVVDVTGVSVAQISTVLNDLSSLPNNHHFGIQIGVSDTAANLSAGFAQLNLGNINSITITDSGPLTVSESSFVFGANTIEKFVGTFTVDVTGVAVANIGTVEFDYSNLTNKASITLSLAVNDTAAHVAGDVGGLNGDTAVSSVAVVDNAANVVANIGTLNGVDHLHVTLTDSGTPALTLTETQLTTDTTVLGAITNASFNIAVTNVLAADVGSIAGDVSSANANGHLTSISVTDNAADIATYFNTLNSTNLVSQIVVSDGPGNEVTLGVSAALSDTTAEGLLYQSDGLTPAQVAVSDTAANVAGNVSGLNGNAHINHVSVVDSAGAVGNNFNQLNGVHNLSITLNDVGTPQLEIYEYQFQQDTTALAAITNANYDIQLFQAHAANVTADAANPHVTSIGIYDTIANIEANFDQLNNNVVSSISFNTGSEITVSAYSGATDTHAELLLSEVGQSVAVSDSAANISAYFGPLSGNGYVNKIIINDGGTISISVAQAEADGHALGELYLADGITPATVTVSDIATAISSAFDDLNANTHVGKIIVTDSDTNEVTISYGQFASDGTALAELYDSHGALAHYSVSDIASNIQSNLDSLNNDARLDHIIISDDGALSLSAESAVNDANAIGKLEDFGGGPVTLAVSDTAANITLYLDQLNGESNISSIVISDSQPLTLTGAQMEDESALSKLSNFDTSGVSINVNDTAAGISAHLAAIAANNDVITITDNNDAALTVSVDELTTYSVILSEITNSDGSTPATIDVLDTAANIEAHIQDLNGNPTPTEIIISDNAALAMSVTEYTTDTSLLARLHNQDGSPYTLNISDNGAAISAALDSLGGDSHIATITDTNEAAITLNVGQITSDAAAMSLLVNGDGSAYTLSVNDTAGNLTTVLDDLNNNSHVTSLVVTDSGSGGEVVVSIAQLATDAHALSELYTDDTLTTLANVTVSDIVANIQGALSALNGDTQVNKIIVSDSATNEVTVNVAQLTSDATALTELYDANGTTPANVTVSDIAANLSGAVLGSLSGNSQVNKIIVSDSGSNEVTVSVAQLAADTTALAELYDANGTTLASVTVSDTAFDIQGGLSALNGDTQVNKIIVSDSGSHEVQVSVAQLSSYATALAELYDADGSTLANVAVRDTASHIQGGLSTLNSDTQVNKIIVSDSFNREVQVSVAQLSSDATALAKLYDVNGFTHANVIVNDIAANLSGSEFDTLNGNTQVNRIIVSDSASNEVTVSVAQLTGDTRALAELYDANGFTLAHVTVSDTAAAISSALDSLNSASQVNAIIVSDGPQNEVTVSVAQLTSDATALGELQNANNGPIHAGLANVTVVDAAYNISLAFDSLDSNGQVNKIVVSDSGVGNEVTLQVAQLASDASALSELYQSDGVTLANVYVNDTAANISGAAFDTLNNDGRVNGIVINDGGTVTITALQAYNDTTALGELYRGNLGVAATVEVLDSAGNIQAQLDNLNGNTHVGSIFVTDTPDFQLSAVTVGTDTTALGLIGADNSGVTIEVTDTGANITTYLDALEANQDVTSITISDNAAITVSTTQLLSTDVDAIGLLVNADTLNHPEVLLTVEDSASNISAHLSDLAGYASAGREITSVVISDNAAVQVAADQLGTDAAIIAEFSNADGSPYQLDITGNADQISTALDTLESYAAGTHVAAITVDGNGAVVVTVGQITSDAEALAKLVNENGSSYTLAVQDLASAVAGDLDGLNSNTHVTSILLTDGGTPLLTITEGQLSDTTALGEITNGVFDVAVTNVLAADATGIGAQLLSANGNATLTSISVTDTGANVSANLNALNGLAHLTSIYLGDVGPQILQTLTITETQLTGDGTALSLINADNSSYDVAVTNVLAADAAGIAAEVGAYSHATLTSISVTDTGANVGSNLDSLNGLANLTAINLTGGTLSITEYSLTNDATALSLINTDNGSYSVAVTNVLAADATGIAGEVGAYSGATLTSISVTDTGANVGTNLDSLNGLAHLTAIYLGYNGPQSFQTLIITETQLTHDGTALTLINADNTGGYDVAVTGVLAADAGGIAAEVAAYSHAILTSISVTDTGANVGGNLGSLNGLAHLTAINLTTNTLTLTETALTSDGTALSLINTDNGAYNVAVTNVLAADASSIAGDVGVYSHATLVSISVTDTAAHVQASLDSLETLALGGTLTSITLTDSSTPTITVTELTYESDIFALNDITGSFNIAITQALAADAVGLSEQPHVSSVSIVDSAANVQFELNELEGIAAKLGTIVLNDDLSPTMTLSASAVESDATVLAKVSAAAGSYTLDVTGAAVSDVTAIEGQIFQGAALSFAVSDSAADVQADLLLGGSSVLKAYLASISSISLNDGSAPTMTLLASTVENDASVFGKIAAAAGSYTLDVTNALISDVATIEGQSFNNATLSFAVSDSAADVQADLRLGGSGVLKSYNASISTISLTDASAPTFTVVDTAANISTYLNQLASSPQFSKITSITVSDNSAVTLSVAQMASDAAVLAKLVNQNSSPYTLIVDDLAANLSGAVFDSLNGNSHVTSIVISDNQAITLSVSELTNDTRALGELTNASGPGYSLTISDTASQISGDLSTLNGNSHVHKIIVTNSGSGGTITLNSAQALGNITALNEMYQANGTSKFLVNISDSSANLSSNLNALEAIASDLGNITITDLGYISVTVAQVIADAAVLANMHYSNGAAYELAINDTAADISANIAALGANGRVTSLTVSDNGVVTATYAQYSQYNGMFYDIQGTHYLDITNVTGQTYSSFTETINGSHQVLLQDQYDSQGNLIVQYAYTYNNDGTETINATGISGKPYTSYVENLDTQHRVTSINYYTSGGSLYEGIAYTYNQDGTTSENITGLSGITLETYLIDHSGNYENQFIFYSNNTEAVNFYENGQTFTSNGEATTINVTSGTSADIFNLNGHFGVVAVNGYVPGSETINWDHTDFANIAAVEAATHAYGANGTEVKLDANDYLILNNVTVAQFEAHTSDWHFI